LRDIWRSKIQSGKTSIKLLLFAVSLILAFFVFSFIAGRKDAIKDNEAGVLVNRNGTFKVYKKGDKPFALPFFQKFYLISTEPVVLSFTDEEAARISLKGMKVVIVASQLTYSIHDAEKAITAYGPSDPHIIIRENIKEETINLLKKYLTSVEILDDAQQRISLIALLHIDLMSIFREKGISISGYQLRYQ
jgi:hypothetical protein